jgi:hypothetical protein
VSSYDPPPQRWRRRSRGDSRRSWRASRRRRRKRQQRRQQPQRRPMPPRQHPRRLRWRLPPKHRQRRHQPRQRHQLSRQPRRSRRQPRRSRRQPRRSRRQPRRSRRRLRGPACPGHPAKLRPLPGLVRRPVPHLGPVRDRPEGCPAPRVPGVLVLLGLAIIPSPPRKEWVSPVRRVPVETAPDLQDHARQPDAPHQRQVAVQGLRACPDLTPR